MRGRLCCIVPENHPLGRAQKHHAGADVGASADRHQSKGIPTGAVMAGMFERAGIEYRMNIKARFGTTVCSLVAAGLGIALIDEFTVAHHAVPGLKVLEIDASTTFETYIAYRSDLPLSVYGDAFIAALRAEMAAVSTAKAKSKRDSKN